MYVYEGDVLIYSFVASTGINGGTRIGNFAVQSKIPNAYGSTWDIWMPDWLGIYWSGGLKWDPCPAHFAKRRDLMGRFSGPTHFLRMRCAGHL